MYVHDRNEHKVGPLRILYFNQHFSTPQGSVGTRSYEMSRRLIEKGHSVTMVCGSYRGGETGLFCEFVSGKRRGTVDGIDVIEFDLAYANADGFLRRSITFLRFALRSVAIAMTERYDVVFATTTPLTAGIPGICARWLRQKPFVFEVRDLWPELPRAMGVIRNPFVLWMMGVLEWVSYRSANRLIGLSPGIVDGIKRRGVDGDRIAMISNGCDLAIFGSEAMPWRPSVVAEDDLLAVFSGTHGPANGLDAVLDAAAVLKRRGRDDVKLLLIGQGKSKSELQQRARVEGLHNVIFHDPVNKARLAGLMKGADVGLQILANVKEFYFGTSPNKFFDYIAAGLPVLNNYPGWLAEIITSWNCGFSVPPGDPDAFADALEQAADDKKKLRMMGDNAKRLAVTSFDRSLLATKWIHWVVGSESGRQS
jgi:glycosyltransferase involved in cell wall biosynthesis